MAREIHDTLAQGFTGVILQLEAAEQVLGENPDELREHLDRAKGLARNSLQEARRSVWNLLPHALEQFPLEEALRQEIRKLESEVPVRSDFQVSGKRRDLPPEAQTALLRICQESLTNVKKHAHAAQVSVNLTYEANAVELEITDDGDGFDRNKVARMTQQGGFGLSSMEQRARQLGGTLKVSSGNGRGTRVESRIPIG
jgi:signal transduction histidine kinase